MGYPPLGYVLIGNNCAPLEIIKILVSYGADVNAESGSDTPLECAIRHKYIDVVKLLVSKGANIRAGRDGWTLLHEAVLEHYVAVDVVKFLVSKGANVNAKDDNGKTPLHHLAGSSTERTEFVEVAKFLISKGAKVNAKTDRGNTPLRLAEVNANMLLVEYLSGVSKK
jgi:ankyrin repeat protein